MEKKFLIVRERSGKIDGRLRLKLGMWGWGRGLGTGKEMVGKQCALGKNYHLHIIKVLLIFQRGLFFFFTFCKLLKKIWKTLFNTKKKREKRNDRWRKKKKNHYCHQ